MNFTTKGNWVLANNFNDERLKYVPGYTIKAGDKTICPIRFTSHHYFKNDIDYLKQRKEAIANALLIAGSPVLLEALTNINNEVIKNIDIGTNPLLMNLFKASQDATQAIKKATEL